MTTQTEKVRFTYTPYECPGDCVRLCNSDDLCDPEEEFDTDQEFEPVPCRFVSKYTCPLYRRGNVY